MLKTTLMIQTVRICYVTTWGYRGIYIVMKRLNLELHMKDLRLLCVLPEI